MNRHQVLTGAANSGDQCFASGNVEGINFTVSISEHYDVTPIFNFAIDVNSRGVMTMSII